MYNGGLTKRIEQDRKHKKKLEKLYKESDGWKVSLHSPEDYDSYKYSHRVTITKPYYERIYFSKKYHKKRSNEKLRHTDSDNFKMKGSGYKRVYDLQWELW